MIKPLPSFILASLALLGICTQASALLVESWENTGYAGIGDSKGPWMRYEKAPEDMSVAFSNKHASEGNYSLAITTKGGWAQAIINNDNCTSALGENSLRKAMHKKLMISVDVYAEESLQWAELDIAMMGNGMEWTQLTTTPMRVGKVTTLRYLTDAKMVDQLGAKNEWFQFIIIVNSKGPGTVYLDNLRFD